MNNINPRYYNKGKIQVTDFIEDQKLSFIEGNIIKYTCRYNDKSGIQDLRKARWYIDKLLELQMDMPLLEENQ